MTSTARDTGSGVRRRLAPRAVHVQRSRRDDPPPEPVQLAIARDGHPLRDARRAVTRHCRGRVPEAVVADLQVIVTELVANVLEHGGGVGGLAVRLTFDAGETGTVVDGDVRVQVSGHGDHRRVPPPETWVLPAPTERSGRGLALVRRLSSAVSVHGDDPTPHRPGRVTITAVVPGRGV